MLKVGRTILQYDQSKLPILLEMLQFLTTVVKVKNLRYDILNSWLSTKLQIVLQKLRVIDQPVDRKLLDALFGCEDSFVESLMEHEIDELERNISAQSRMILSQWEKVVEISSEVAAREACIKEFSEMMQAVQQALGNNILIKFGDLFEEHLSGKSDNNLEAYRAILRKTLFVRHYELDENSQDDGSEGERESSLFVTHKSQQDFHAASNSSERKFTPWKDSYPPNPESVFQLSPIRDPLTLDDSVLTTSTTNSLSSSATKFNHEISLFSEDRTKPLDSAILDSEEDIDFDATIDERLDKNGNDISSFSFRPKTGGMNEEFSLKFSQCSGRTPRSDPLCEMDPTCTGGAYGKVALSLLSSINRAERELKKGKEVIYISSEEKKKGKEVINISSDDSTLSLETCTKSSKEEWFESGIGSPIDSEEQPGQSNMTLSMLSNISPKLEMIDGDLDGVPNGGAASKCKQESANVDDVRINVGKKKTHLKSRSCRRQDEARSSGSCDALLPEKKRRLALFRQMESSRGGFSIYW